MCKFFNLKIMSTVPIITESFVQKVIKQDFDRVHFQSNNAGYVGTEVYTKNSKRADVLFAFRRTKKGIYTVVIEAKSRNTLGDLKPKDSFKKQVNIARVLALLFYLFGIYYFWDYLNFEFQTIGILLVSLVGVIMILTPVVSKFEFASALTIPALEQLNNYPANEKWLAIASDTFVNDNDYYRLSKYCKQARIGLIIVDEYGDIDVVFFACPTEEMNQYISKYKKKDEIRAFLAKKKKFKTPAEEAKTSSQSKWGCRYLLVFLAFLFMLVNTSKKENTSKSNLFSIPKKENVIEQRSEKFDEEFNVQNGEDLNISVNCGKFQKKATFFVVIESVCYSESWAKNRVQELKKIGLSNFDLVNSSCLYLC